MTLEAFVKINGTKSVSRALNIDPSTLYYWRTGRSFPRPNFMVEIQKLSEGKVSYADMVHDYLRRNKTSK